MFAGLVAGTWLGSSATVYLFAAGCASATLLFLSAGAALGHSSGRLLHNSTALLWLDRAVGLFLPGFALTVALDIRR